MKIGFRDTDAFVKNPPRTLCAILLYGPDQGLVNERAAAIGQTVVPDLNDAFSVAELDPETIADDPSRLCDEANALSMLGGRRLIRVRQADDKITQACKALLDGAVGDNLVIIESDNLGPKSPLRLLFEKAKNAAALPCYIEDGRALSQIIRELVEAHGKSLERDAVPFLERNLKGDRLQVRSEIDKLCVYAGKNPVITLDDCRAVIAAEGETGFSEIAFAFADGALGTLNHKLAQAFEEGFPAPALLRAMQNHLKRLYTVKQKIARGMPPKEAMEAVNPPVFWKEQAAFQSQLNRWSERRLEITIMGLMRAEIDSKTSHIPAETVTAETLFRLSKF